MKIRRILAVIYSFPGLIASVILFLYGALLFCGAGAGAVWGSIATIIDFGGYIFTGEHHFNFSDFHQPVSSITGFQNHFLLSLTFIFFSIFILLLIIGIAVFANKKLGVEILEIEGFWIFLTSIMFPYSHFNSTLSH